MKFIISIKGRIESFYRKYPRIMGYAGRLVFALCCFLILRANCGYNESLTNIWVVLVLGIFCAFAPLRILTLIILIYAMVQLLSLSIGVGLICVAVLVTVYLIYFRFDERYVYLVLLIPMCSMIRLPLLIPLILAATGPLSGLFAVIFGNLIYYMIRYISLNAAVINGMTEQSEYQKMSFAANGIFTNTEFLYTLVIMVIVFLLVFYMRRLNLNQANNLAIAVGSGVDIIMCIAANLIFGTLSTNRLVVIVVGGVLSGLFAALIVYAVLPLDYTRIETFEFEDEEYRYYVRAVPKAVIKKEAVRVKKINSRKEVHPKRVRENEK